jgi:hypothetical protein
MAFSIGQPSIPRYIPSPNQQPRGLCGCQLPKTVPLLQSVFSSYTFASQYGEASIYPAGSYPAHLLRSRPACCRSQAAHRRHRGAGNYIAIRCSSHNKLQHGYRIVAIGIHHWFAIAFRGMSDHTPKTCVNANP